MESPFSSPSALFREHVDGVYNVAYRVLWNGADAEDVVQNTFLTAFSRRDQLADGAKIRPWLLTIAYREAISVLRRRRDQPTEPSQLPVIASRELGPEEVTQQQALAERIARAFRNLPDNLRSAVVLRDIEELTMIDVAQALSIGVSAAKMRVSRGRELLRLELSDELS